MKGTLTISFCLLLKIAFAQIDFTPGSGNITHCPGELKTYTSSVQGSECGVRNWTITKGVFVLSNGTSTTATGNEVDVRWNDVAEIGTLKVSVTCGTEVFIEEKNFSIRSLAGRVPANAIALQQLPYCSITPVLLIM